MQTVNLVTTIEKLLADFPEEAERLEERRLHNHRKPASANYPIDPSRCQTKLGQWLAARIFTTRFDDDGSRCCLLFPQTRGGMDLFHFSEKLRKAKDVESTVAVRAIIAEIRQFADEMERIVECYGDSMSELVTDQYRWPVFGSKAIEAETAEAYFDQCAGLIRRTGGVILRAGLDATPPPDSLAATMASGHGLHLLHRFQRKQTATAVA